MQQKHTPGPWSFECGYIPGFRTGLRSYDAHAGVLAGGGKILIAEFNNVIPEGEANARLIAAAPDLLEVCQAFLRAGFGNSTDFRLQAEATALARTAIAKATGRTP